MDVRHLGTTDTLIDPADDVTQYALDVVVELFLNLIRRVVAPVDERRRQQIIQPPDFAPSQLLLPPQYIHLVVMQSMQSRGRWGWHPGGRGAAHGMGNFL